MHQCHECGKLFEAEDPYTDFCSTECSDKQDRRFLEQAIAEIDLPVSD